MKHKYDIDMYLVAMDLMAEMKLLTDLDPNLHDQMKALEDENNLYFGYENFYTGKMYKKKKSYVPIKVPRLTPEELKRKRRRLLLLIDVKYGGIANDEGTWELKND